MSVKCIPPLTPLLYSKTGVCRGIHIFLIFVPKLRLWILVKTASAVKINQLFPMTFSNFNVEKSPCMLHGQVVIMLI